MNHPIDESRLTAYALGETEGSEKQAIEAQLAQSADARAFVDEQVALAELLSSELSAEPALLLDDARRSAILNGRLPARRSPMFVLRVAAAAAFVLMVASPWIFQSRPEAPGKAQDETLDAGLELARSDRDQGGLERDALLDQAIPADGQDRADDVKAFDKRLKSVRKAVEAFDAQNGLMEMAKAEIRQVEALPETRSVGAIFLAEDVHAPSVGMTPRKNASPTVANKVTPDAKRKEVALSTETATIDRSREKQVPAGDPARILDAPVAAVEIESVESVESVEHDRTLSLYLNKIDEVLRRSGEAYAPIVENAFLDPRQEPLATLAADVDTGAWSNIRRLLRVGAQVPPDAVRIEEMLNYFHYEDLSGPEDGQPIAFRGDVASCPWEPEHRLMRVTMRARDLDRGRRPAANLVFLVDVSGSMKSEDKLPLLKQCLAMLVEGLDEGDHVSIVTYASNSGVALEPTSCEQKSVILDAIARMSAEGSTNGAAGITTAYEMARRHFLTEGINRVILCTDGDFNVGVTDRGTLDELIKEEATTGVFLSIFGFGTGNLKEATLESLADKGNGHYGYIDSLREGRRILSDELESTLVVVAKDVKLQVEFNPQEVASYRLIGYENRTMAAQDFNDDAKDGGEVGAGDSLVAFFEIVPARGSSITHATGGRTDALKYQDAPVTVRPEGVSAEPGEVATMKMRYKDPGGSESRKVESPVIDEGRQYQAASSDFRFAAAVASFGLVLRRSVHRGTATIDQVIELGLTALGDDVQGWRTEFIDLAREAKKLGY
ncbi:MAG: von Willebrand factor type A domain-containing protein [Planctomycetes bacterium]|nr:von Willebrand factor type A domain-containing protein [Planctomycetota bacterium]